MALDLRWAPTGRLAWSAFRKQVPALVFGLMSGVGFFALATSHLVSRGFDVSPPSPSAWIQAISALLILLLVVLVPSLIKLRRIPVALLLKQD
ncbi:MAG: hypothetical protein IPK97_21130 [Ahniella sp.]|nr:hypothetical protein [Ahniella sp.]